MARRAPGALASFKKQRHSSPTRGCGLALWKASSTRCVSCSEREAAAFAAAATGTTIIPAAAAAAAAAAAVAVGAPCGVLVPRCCGTHTTPLRKHAPQGKPPSLWMGMWRGGRDGRVES
jgi:hypothetical protein